MGVGESRVPGRAADRGGDPGARYGAEAVIDGERYCDGILVRAVRDGAHPFCAGLLIDRATDRVVLAAPILRHLMGQPADKLRQGFKRLGWRATIVRRATK